MIDTRTSNKQRRIAASRAKVASALLISCAMVFAACGCSEERTISDTKKERVVVQVNDCEEASNGGQNSASDLSGGNKIDIPDEYDGKQHNDVDFYETGYGKWASKWASMQTSQQAPAQKWIEEGRQFKHHLPYFPNEDRYGVVLRAKHDDSWNSNKDGKWGLGWGGDYVDIVYKDGKILKGIIIDEKGSDAGTVEMSHYGHVPDANTLKVCEWITEADGQPFTKDISDLKADNEMNYIFGVVDYVINYGDNSTSGSGSAPKKETSSNAATATVTASGSSELVGEDVPEQVWNFFKAAGFSDESTAAIMGNLEGESGMKPDNIQGNGAGPAAGICQMETYQDYSSRWGQMAKKAEANGKDWTDLLSQLQFMLEDAPAQFQQYTGHGTHTYPNGTVTWWPEAMTVEEFAELTDIDKATEIYMRVFERPSIPHLDRRIASAYEYYERFKGTAKTGNDAVQEKCSEEGIETGGDVAVGEAAGIEGDEARIKFLWGDAGIPTTPEENEKYLEEFEVEILKEGGGRTTSKVIMHKKLKSEVQAIFKEMANAGFRVTSTEGLGFDPWRYNDTFGGKWPWSGHAYGYSFDVNPNENYCIYANGDQVGTHYSPGQDPLSMDDKIVGIWKKHGFYWGGDWTSLKDYMHFSYFNH